ncbi:dihydrolipoamide acetyltransferase family protein [Burkholderia oklahomensis]|uniref:Dihydrolipoamide acetyltransferase component of pyruvate dehydrogenase complex n=3 Tax=Burkholderia oklahomensis TaxID=342113 RepID=A0AAI8BEW5_9BURK|nr:dihydrolipoamide acetyltransferase family protein [Burkholderia oklahomensis]AIO70836.1 lipoamide acyltransferase component of branched-chain alpha-keto acid dehydrogenase complex [Burkholderia oklahomensis]AOI40366.1 branched-chain alpha-keto acid dehydrogenase subunit E2 [Burkholderia oklahomensis EO147]KUY65105.1 branched-chain alpha-keto acid dehydrogenase subunit E2 [Burkholderia oklahomensis EO147]QPS41582.1 2-oxo acid dehydrogenase subunit E2 [Burkholderia oklahomensis]
MGIHVIKMPDIGEGIAEVELGLWHVKIGDRVKEDQAIADVMTDKASVEIPSPVTGVVVALGGKEGDVLAVGSELVRLEIEGEGNHKGDAANGVARGETAAAQAVRAAEAAHVHANVGAQASRGERDVDDVRAASRDTSHASDDRAARVGYDASSGASSSASSATTDADARSATREPAAPPPARRPGERPLASPAVRKRAWDLGIELRYVHGTGEAGRILHEDLDAYLQGRGVAVPGARGGHAAYVERHDEEAVPVIGLRRKIAQRMQDAKRRIPHFSYVEEIDVTELEALRAELNRKYGEARGRLTMLPFLARAMVIALRDFPQINARYDDEAGVVTRHGAVHLGIATQSKAGLMVPVVRHAEARDPWAIAAEIARLADAVRNGRAERDELSGSTITITSLGALGGIASTPVINSPEVGIVGVNRIVERPMFRNGAVVARKLMNLSSSFDHRVIDGMDAAEFIQAVRALLEQPALLFVE